jgi:hypothetical protein
MMALHLKNENGAFPEPLDLIMHSSWHHIPGENPYASMTLLSILRVGVLAINRE